MASANYRLMCRQLSGFLEITKSPLAILSNAAAILWQGMSNINWAGFYLKKDNCLTLGPFQGKPACCLISNGKGVCGRAMETGKIQVVENVHQFPGHIACDCASNSEIVVPIVKSGTFLGVLDIDSPVLSRFTMEDSDGLSQFCQVLLDADWEQGLL